MVGASKEGRVVEVASLLNAGADVEARDGRVCYSHVCMK